MELALSARGVGELRSLTADLPDRAAGRTLSRLVGLPVAAARRVRRRWRTVGLPRLMLPEPAGPPVRIGRNDDCDLRLADVCVSRSHALLRSDGLCWRLRDLGSTNGTWVNGVRVIGEVTVEEGDAVRFGQSAFRICAR